VSVDAYIAWLDLRGCAATTITKRRGAIARISRRLGCPLLEATPAALASWYSDLAKRVTPGSRAAELSTLRSYYKWAMEQGLIDLDPVRRLPMPRIGRRYPRPISEASLAKALDSAPDRVRPMLILAACQGLRACEIAALRREDVVDYVPEPVLFVQPGKGDKQRILPLHPRVPEALQGLPRSGWLFPHGGKPGQPIPPHRASHLCNEHLHSVGISDTLHSLRHRFGSTLYQQTYDLRLTQDMMGHSNPNTTAGYATWHRPDAARAFAAMSLPDQLREPTASAPTR
jgi:integrase